MQPPLDFSWISEEGGLAGQHDERDHDRDLNWQLHAEEHWVCGEPPNGFKGEVHICEADINGKDWQQCRDGHDEKLKSGERSAPGRSLSDEGSDENSRHDASTCRTNLGWMRQRGKIGIHESSLVSQQHLTSPG